MQVTDEAKKMYCSDYEDDVWDDDTYEDDYDNSYLVHPEGEDVIIKWIIPRKRKNGVRV